MQNVLRAESVLNPKYEQWHLLSAKLLFMHKYIYPSIFIQHWLKTISIGPTVKTKTFKFD